MKKFLNMKDLNLMTSQEREDNFKTLYNLYLTEVEIEKKLVAKDYLTRNVGLGCYLTY